MKRIVLVLAVVMGLTNVALAGWSPEVSVGAVSYQPDFEQVNKVIDSYNGTLEERRQVFLSCSVPNTPSEMRMPNLKIGIPVSVEVAMTSPEGKWKIGGGVSYWKSEGFSKSWLTSSSGINTNDSANIEASILNASIFAQRNFRISKGINYFLGLGCVYIEPSVSIITKVSTDYFQAGAPEKQTVTGKFITSVDNPVVGFTAKTGTDFDLSKKVKLGIEVGYICAAKSKGNSIFDYEQVSSGFSDASGLNGTAHDVYDEGEVEIDPTGLNVCVYLRF